MNMLERISLHAAVRPSHPALIGSAGKVDAGAVKALKRALAAPARADRPVADNGRREEIRLVLQKAEGNL